MRGGVGVGVGVVVVVGCGGGGVGVGVGVHHIPTNTITTANKCRWTKVVVLPTTNASQTTAAPSMFPKLVPDETCVIIPARC